MIIARAPYRISLLGGSTEYVPWLQEHDGLVIGTTINQYSTIIVRNNPPIFDYFSKFVYSDTEIVDFNIDVKHKVIAAAVRQLDIDFGIEMTHLADLPSKSGIGSSSSFLVAMLHAFSSLKKIRLFRPEIYQLAVHIEQNILKENIGLQDSAWATWGGFNSIAFTKKIFEPTVTPIQNLNAVKQLEKDMIFAYSGIQRKSHDIAAVYLEKKSENNQARIYDMALEGLGLLEDGDIYGFGNLISKSWEEKRSISSSISHEMIDDAYFKAKQYGAYGFKLCGAGAGGCIMILAPREKHSKILDSLRFFRQINLKFEDSGVHLV